MNLSARTTRVTERWAALLGARRWSVSILSMVIGALLALALPPFNLVGFLILFGWPVLWLARAAGAWAAFWIGWTFGFGYFVAGLYWISNALLVYGYKHAWLVPFAAAGLPAVLAVYWGIAALACHAVDRCLSLGPVARALFFAAFLSLAEWARGVALTGFPWNLPAYAWSESYEILQMASVVGAYGLSALTLALGCTLGVLLQPGLSLRSRIAVPSVAVVLLSGVWIWGAERLPDGPAPVRTDTIVRLVQGNIPQALKWKRELREAHLARYVQMTRAPEGVSQPQQLAGGTSGASLPDPSVVIWPETAAPMLLNEAPRVIELLAAAAPRSGSLITGAPRIDRGGVPDGERPRFYNSAFIIPGADPISDAPIDVRVYDKSHLVPFGEYVPFRDLLGIGSIAGRGTDFSAGPGVRVLEIDGLGSVVPLICYEIIFPGAVVPPEGERPQVLLNLTNDAWYGYSTGPFQHYAISAMRAVEEGIPVIRSANTGISGVIDPYGRTVGSLELQYTGVLDTMIPEPKNKVTTYVYLGNYGFFIIVVTLTGIGIIVFRR